VVLDAGIVHTKEWFPHVTDKIADTFRSGAGYIGLPEYAPLGERQPLPADAPLISLADPGAAESARIRVKAWSPEKKVIVADLSRSARLNVKVLAYPAWQARVNGKPVDLRENPETGQLMVLLPAGSSRTEIKFGRTWDRSAGIVISIASSAALFVFWKLFALNRKRSRQSRAVKVAAEQAA